MIMTITLTFPHKVWYGTSTSYFYQNRLTQNLCGDWRASRSRNIAMHCATSSATATEHCSESCICTSSMHFLTTCLFVPWEVRGFKIDWVVPDSHDWSKFQCSVLKPILTTWHNAGCRAHLSTLHRDLRTLWQHRWGHRGHCSPSNGLSAGEFDVKQVALCLPMQSGWRRLASSLCEWVQITKRFATLNTDSYITENYKQNSSKHLMTSIMNNHGQ